MQAKLLFLGGGINSIALDEMEMEAAPGDRRIPVGYVASMISATERTRSRWNPSRLPFIKSLVQTRGLERCFRTFAVKGTSKKSRPVQLMSRPI